MRTHQATVKMPRPRTAWSIVAVDVLSDGEWHHIDELTVKMAPTIPQEKALSTYDNNWLSDNPQPVNARIAQGRRYILRHALGNLRKSGTVIQDGDLYRAGWVC